MSIPKHIYIYTYIYIFRERMLVTDRHENARIDRRMWRQFSMSVNILCVLFMTTTSTVKTSVILGDTNVLTRKNGKHNRRVVYQYTSRCAVQTTVVVCWVVLGSNHKVHPVKTRRRRPSLICWTGWWVEPVFSKKICGKITRKIMPYSSENEKGRESVKRRAETCTRRQTPCAIKSTISRKRENKLLTPHVQVTMADKDSHFNLSSASDHPHNPRSTKNGNKTTIEAENILSYNRHADVTKGPPHSLRYYHILPRRSRYCFRILLVQLICPKLFQLYRSLWRRDDNVVRLFHFHVPRKFWFPHCGHDSFTHEEKLNDRLLF